MKKIILLLAFTVFTVYGFSQHVMSALNGQSIEACSGSFTLGSYTAGQSFTMTACSSDPLAKHVTLFIGGGYNFPAGTSLCIYDGPNASAPLLGCYNNTTVGGTLATQATNMNESGCLTFVFTGPVIGASWTGTFSCNFICQPRQVDIVSAAPAIQGDGYINVCWDENANHSMPIQFTAQGTYPSTAYPCNDANNTFFWNFQDGTPIVSGLGMSVVSHNFPARQGYTVIVTIEDSEGCENTNSVTQRVRVSRAPVWNNTTTTVNPHEICMGIPVTMCGYYTAAEWSSAVIPVNGAMVNLPDTPPLCFESNLLQNAFEPGQLLTSVNDLLGIHMSLCHTYLGDLTFYIQCPNGQQVQMGIQGGGGCDLGNPPNTGFWYNITPTATQTMQQAAIGNNPLPAGNYASYAPLSGLLNCPLNGLWKIRICDNWGQDAGKIFGWYLEFNPSLYPEIWSYTPTYTPTSWEGQYGSNITPPTNLNCATGTYLTTATPDVNSIQPFIFTVTDNFGCEHDTALYVNVFHQLDPNCCIIPTVNAGADVSVCALTYSLSATPLEFPSSNGYWELVSGPSTVTFANSTNPNTIVTVAMYGTYTFEWHELYQGNPGCANSDQVVITFNETFNPALTPVSNVCVNTAPFIISAVNFGTLTCTPNPSLLNVSTGQFNPTIPGSYTITNTVNDPCSGGPLVSTISFAVYDEIEVLNFSEECSGGANPDVIIQWDVVGSAGNPFSNYLVNNVVTPNPHFTQNIPSPAAYSYVITDSHECSTIEINGARDCECPLYAGTMGSLQTVVLCADECTAPDVTHNGNQTTDSGLGIFEFMIHNGNNVPIAYSSTPNFCRTTPPGFQYNTIYYVSAICGYPAGSHADISGGCYSIAVGTPVMWLENPIAFAGSNKDTCGLIIRLAGNTPAAGMYGYWSSTCDFFAVGGTSHTQPNALVMSTAYSNCTMTWNVVNGECVASDDVVIRFLQTPSPWAGNDIVVCGNSTTMAGTGSTAGISYSWSGSSTSFNPQSSLTAAAQTSVFGTYQYTLTADNGSCSGTDKVLVTYIQPPSPVTTPNVDTVCGNQYNLSVITVPNPVGSWVAYDWNGTDWVVMAPAPSYSPNNTSTSASVTIANFLGEQRPVRFIWTETNSVLGTVCTASAHKDVVFAKAPQASVGASNQREICGNCITFNASSVGIDGYQHYWIPKILGDWTNPEGASAPNATYCIQVPAAFGDTAYVETAFLWAVKNGGCVALDTMYVTFYQQPNANAGLDKAVCGNENDMNAIWGISPNAGYTPSGIWSVGTHPNGESATFTNTSANNSHVTVSEVGIWEFIFTDQNSFLTGCYDTDTVQIEFVEVPIISAGPDKDVCGNCTTMDGMTGGFGGSWLPNGGDFIDFSDPHSNVCVAAYVPTTFTWLESNSATTQVLSCTSTDDVVITFWRVPTANILTPPSDSTVCGLTFYNLRAESPGTGITGYWYNINPATVYGNAFSNNTWAKVPSYGYHNFYWIEQTGPGLTPGFCNDTAGPLRIKFIQVPTANAGGDTLFCGYSGKLNAIPSVGTGVWTTPSGLNITFANQNDPKTLVTSEIINTGHPTIPNFRFIWTENNSTCTDKDTVVVVFARIPTAEMDIISPKCFGEPATIAASEDTLQQYSWSFNTGVVDHFTTNSSGGRWENFVYWNSTDTAHRVSLIATNHWGCQSPIRVDTVYEPIIPTFDIKIIMDTCALGKGGIVFGDTLGTSAFFWVDPNVGPAPETPITTVYNLPAGEYGINTSYLTPNIVNYAYYLQTFGTANCVDTFYYEIDLIGMIDAEISVLASVLLTELVAPDAVVTFLNTSDYDDVSKRCEWHFGDGSILKTCDELVEHTYTKANCYEPFLIVMNRNLPECRDTARLETCIFVDDASKLEVPNVFSPNGDGINDFFQVKARTLRTFTGTITNRWGRTVYEWSDWETYEAGWDGTIGGGSKAAPGVYFYIITAEGLDGTPYNPKGALHLLSE